MEALEITDNFDTKLISLVLENEDNFFNTFFDIEPWEEFSKFARTDLSIVQYIIDKEAQYLFTAHLYSDWLAVAIQKNVQLDL